MEYRGFLIEGDGEFGYKAIKPVGRGSVPTPLRGAFTTTNFAQRTIDLFLMTKKDKSNAEGVNSD